MSKAVGAYVRRKGRKSSYIGNLREAPFGYGHFVLPSGAVVSIAKEGPMIQAMPVLTFEDIKAT